MPISSPTDLHKFLEEEGLSARKSLSQNFLTDSNILNKIVGAAQINAQDTICEIGPGPGALTEKILETGAHVVAIEKDRSFAAALERLQTADGCLEVHCADALELPFETLVKLAPMKLVANLPYNITTPLLTRLIPRRDLFSSLTIMVQKEVAERICATEESPDYGSLSIFVRFYGQPKLCFTVSPNCFFPRPSVTSAVVHIALHNDYAEICGEKFLKFTRRAFQQRRKKLTSSLADLYPKQALIDALERCGIRLDARPEQLSLNQFTLLFETLSK